MAWRVIVTSHAVERAAVRFPDLQLDEEAIEREVREAIAAGRISSEKPAAIGGVADPHTMYVWTAASQRFYAVRTSEDAFYVVTTLSPPPPTLVIYCSGHPRSWEHVGGGRYRCPHCGVVRKWAW